MKNFLPILLLVFAGVIANSIFGKPTPDPDPAGTGSSSGAAPGGPDPDGLNMKFKQEVQPALMVIYQKYGREIAEQVERIYRNETTSKRSGTWKPFDSVQFLRTGSPGMEAARGEPGPYYGWKPRNWSSDPANMLPYGTVKMTDSGGREVRFMKFRSVYAAMKYLAEFLREKGRPGAWFSTDPNLQGQYEQRLSQIIPRYVNSINKA